MKAEPFVTYSEALDWLHGLLRFGQKPGLERMNWMLAELDHPHRRLAFVHVAGTNGKGSTCAYLTQMLMEAGYSVGTFTSPYVVDFRERIRYNGQMIPEKDLLQLANRLKPLVERCAETEYGSPTEFEVITVLALLYFAERVRPSVVVWETGLGGRLDSTNVVHPLVSVITNVGLDHTDVLGATIEEIAREKAGIIKPGVPVVLGDLEPRSLAVIEETARAKRSSLYRLGREFHAEPLPGTVRLGSQQFRYQSVFHPRESVYTLEMNGGHQVTNAGVALMAIDLLKEFFAFMLEEEEISRGLQQTRWPGRLEVVSNRPLVVLDGAHNQEGMEALAKSLRELVPDHVRVHVLVAALADKPLSRMAAAWAAHGPNTEAIHLTSFEAPRAAQAEVLRDAFCAGGLDPDRISLVLDWRSFLRGWMTEAGHQDDMLVACGSLYFIAQVRTFLQITVEEAGE